MVDSIHFDISINVFIFTPLFVLPRVEGEKSRNDCAAPMPLHPYMHLKCFQFWVFKLLGVVVVGVDGAVGRVQCVALSLSFSLYVHDL